MTALTTRPMVRTTETSMPETASTMTRIYGIRRTQSMGALTGMAAPDFPINIYSTATIRAAGPAILMFILNLSAIEQPWVRVAAMVVSDMKDRLSPKKAPPTMIAVMKGTLAAMPSAPAAASSWAIPAATGTRATMVPTLVPMAIEMKQAARKSPA